MVNKHAIMLLVVCFFCVHGTALGRAATPQDTLNAMYVDALLAAYPNAGMQVETDAEGTYVIVNHVHMLFEPSSGCPEPDPEAFADQAICVSLQQLYPAGAGGRDPKAGVNPGRVRHEALLEMLYGSSREGVQKNLVAVPFLGQRVLFNARQGAAAALERVGQRLEPVVAAQPHIKNYILPFGGAFAWRGVAGTNRLSAHSFGIALDLNVKKGAYWRWNKRTDAVVQAAKEHYPQAIVEAFEAEGFIWGGKWDAFDYMHFEYRPELLRLRY